MFDNQHDSCLGRHVNAASLKCLEIQALVLSQNQIKILNTNRHEFLFLAATLDQGDKISEETVVF